MKNNCCELKSAGATGICAALLLLAGCATTDSGGSAVGASASHASSRFRTPDSRVIDIGKSSPSDGGLNFRNPHLNQCWVADGFDFNGYDTLYIAPTLSTAKFHDDEQRPHELAKENLVIELGRSPGVRALFPNIVTRESDLKPGAHVLKLENTIVEYAKGGGGARYFVGLYGGGQPVIRVQGKLSDVDKTVFKFEGRRSGVSAGARMNGVFMKDEDIQVEDIRSLVIDLTDFMMARAGKYQPKN